MIKYDLQTFGGRGSSGGKTSGGGNSQLKNAANTSNRAVDIVLEGRNKVVSFGLGNVEVNKEYQNLKPGERFSKSVVDKALEKEITSLASENSLKVSFTTKTNKEKSLGDPKGIRAYTHVTKTRVAFFYK